MQLHATIPVLICYRRLCVKFWVAMCIRQVLMRTMNVYVSTLLTSVP
ncbi:hypothetical protein EVA_07384 [gut metagenome]|uniref:Uncharacterized protein n=1 Tax=gut metagenome TaxID=749906 RepID=J9GQ05_9ZZZZ